MTANNAVKATGYRRLTAKDGDFAGEFFQTKKLQDNWYWTAAN